MTDQVGLPSRWTSTADVYQARITTQVVMAAARKLQEAIMVVMILDV